MNVWLGFFCLVLALLPLGASAAPAQAGEWLKNCGPQGTTGISGGQIACYTPASGADDESASPVLNVQGCENIDVFLHDDYDGDGTACTVTWDIEACPPGTLSTDATRNNACNTLAGITSLTGDDVESNLAAEQVRVHGENAGANISSCQIVVKCAEGASQ